MKISTYNYINIITPFKHHFAKTDDKKQAIKENGSHIYDRCVEFSEYYNLFLKERGKYNNINYFEINFKTAVSYVILTNITIANSDNLKLFLDGLLVNLGLMTRYSVERINHLKRHINDLKNDVFKYADVYCFFDRMSLGNILTVFTGLSYDLQDKIFKILKNNNLNYSVNKKSLTRKIV